MQQQLLSCQSLSCLHDTHTSTSLSRRRTHPQHGHCITVWRPAFLGNNNFWLPCRHVDQKALDHFTAFWQQ